MNIRSIVSYGLFVALAGIASRAPLEAHGLGVGEPYEDHGIEDEGAMLLHTGYWNFIAQRDPNDYGRYISQTSSSGGTIRLINEAGPGQMPTASVSWFSMVNPHFFGNAALSNNSFSFELITPAGIITANPAAGDAPPGFTVNPLIHGWTGSVTAIWRGGDGRPVLKHKATWDFSPPKCETCKSGTCSIQAKIGSIDLTIPLGGDSFGNDANQLEFKSETLANLGAGKLRFVGKIGAGGSTLTYNGDVINTVTTGNSVATVINSPSSEDENRFEILFTYLSDPRPSPADPVYRKVTVERIDGVVRIIESTEEKSKTYEFSNATANTWVLEEAGLRKTSKIIVSETAATKVIRHKVEEKTADNQWKTVSLVEEHEKRFTWGWEMIQSITDPDGAALISSYDYYERDPNTDPLTDQNALGRIKCETLPTGFVRNYFYLDHDPYLNGFSSVDVIKEHFASSADGKEIRIHRSYSAGLATILEEVWVLGNLVSKKETVSTASSRTEKSYPSATGIPLVTTTTYNNGSEETIRPDGTVRKVVNTVANNLLTESICDGVKNTGSGHYLVRGTEMVTVKDRRGVVQTTILYKIHGGTAFRSEERRMMDLDHQGRAHRIDVYHGNSSTPTYAEILSYSCCGLSMETGQDGITSQYFYDGLGRRWKTHQNGVSEETIYDGLTIHTHRFAEALATATSGANAANELINLTYNLAGDQVSAQKRSPKDGTLITTTTQTLYHPVTGVGRSLTTIEPQTADDQGVAPITTEEYYLDDTIKSRSGPLVVDEAFQYGSASSGLTETSSKVATGGTTYETVVRQKNFLGKPITETFAGDKDSNGQPDEISYAYNGDGSMKSMTDPDGVITLYSTNPATGIEITAVDVNRNQAIDSAVDRIQIRHDGFGLDTQGKVMEWSEQAVRDLDSQGQSVEKTVSRTEQSVDGSTSISIVIAGSQSASTKTVREPIPNQPGDWNVVRTNADLTFAVSRYRSGILVEEESYSSTNVSLFKLTYGYDTLQRVTSITDTRGPSVSYQYVSALVDQVNSTTAGSRVSLTTYDERGRMTALDEPDTLDDAGNTVANIRITAYWPDGSVRERSGTPGYRESYTYDDAGRIQTLTTYGTQTAVTRWEYDADRGWLTRKRYNSPAPGQGTGESYTYTAGGRLDHRTLARGVVIDHDYDTAGNYSSVSYSDGTPSTVVSLRDQLGRIKRITDGGGERTLVYDAWGQLASESHTGSGVLAGWEITRNSDAIGRLSGLGVGQLGTGVSQHFISYGFDTAGRLETVTSDGKSAAYRYNPTHQKVEQISLSSGTTPVLYGTLQYDALSRLKRISYHDGNIGGSLKVFSDFDYQRDTTGKITAATREDKSKQQFGYNPTAEVVSAKHLLTGTGSELIRGQTFKWTYDGIGNRLTSERGGDAAGAGLRQATYAPNALNQYSSILNPNSADVTGTAVPTDTVTVNGQSTNRQGAKFQSTVSGSNSSGPVWKSVTVNDGTTTKTGSLLIPPASQSFTYDDDGNLQSDGIYQYTWDGENRLIKIEVTPAAVTAGVPYQRVENTYDSQWRKIRRLRYDQPTGSALENTRYLWAGWRCLAEVGASNVIEKALACGLDSDQQMNLGDGNGALLWIKDIPTNTTHFCHYDGNGNIVGLSNTAGTETAKYSYSAFGELLEKTGAYADTNKYRFSTKLFEEVGCLYYYGYRYYTLVSGRWISRDPVGEKGGINTYGMIGNDTVNHWDRLGLAWGYGPGEFPGPFPIRPAAPVAPITPWPEVGVGVALSGAAALFYGFEVSKSVTVTSKCRVCVTYAITRLGGIAAFASAGVGPVFTYSPSGSDGESESMGGGAVGGWGAGGGGAIEGGGQSWGNGSIGGGYSRIGPTFGGGFMLRRTISQTGCANFYPWGPLAMMVADDRARALVNAATGFNWPVLGL